MALQSNGGGVGARGTLAKLRLSAYAVMMVALVLALSAAAHTIRGINLWMHTQVDPESSVFGDGPSDMDLEYFEQERRRSARQATSGIAVGILLAICGLAWVSMHGS